MPGSREDHWKQRKEGRRQSRGSLWFGEKDCAKKVTAFIVSLGDNNVLQWDAIQRGKKSSYKGLYNLF